MQVPYATEIPLPGQPVGYPASPAKGRGGLLHSAKVLPTPKPPPAWANPLFPIAGTSAPHEPGFQGFGCPQHTGCALWKQAPPRRFWVRLEKADRLWYKRMSDRESEL